MEDPVPEVMEKDPAKKKACATCTKAKAKCTAIQGRDSCERCARLGRECLYDEVVRRRKRRNVTRMARLEERVEDLLGLLSQRQAPNSENASGTREAQMATVSRPVQLPTPETLLGSEASTGASSTSRITEEDMPFQSVNFFPEDDLPKGPDIVDKGILNIQTAERLLDKYRAVKMMHFPFVAIPPDVDAEHLRKRSPFLFLAVMAACHERDLKMQHVLRLEIKQEISRRLIMNEERSLDLLSGLMVHICWCHYHVSPKRKMMFLLNQMALTIVIDLGLDRSSQNFNMRVGVDDDKIPSDSCTNKYGARRRSNAEYRAFLGCYYLCSILALFRRSTFMRHSGWVDECCKILEEAKEYPSDAWLKHFIATRHMAQRIIEGLAWDEHVDAGTTRNPALLEMTMKGLKAEVDQLEERIKSSSAKVCLGLLLEVKALVVTIYEVAVCYKPSTIGPFSALHATHLWNLLTSCRTLLTAQIAVPPAVLEHTTLPTFKLIWYGFMLLIKFDVIPSSHSWDAEIARKEANVDALAEDVLNLLKSIQADDRSENVWSHFARGMQSLRRWQRERAAKISANSNGAMPTEDLTPTTSTTNSSISLQLGRAHPGAHPPFSPSAPNSAPSASYQAFFSASPNGDPSNMGDSAWATMGNGEDPLADFYNAGLMDDAMWRRLMDEFAASTNGAQAMGLPDTNTFGYG